MKVLFMSLMSLGLLVATGAHAQVPAGAPAGTTGLCKDGSFTSADTKKGACRGHKGIKEWYAAAPAAANDSAAAPSKKSSKTETAATTAPATAPAASTGLCRDGTFTSRAERRGACRGHHGVKEWFGAGAATAATSAAAAPMAPAAPAATPAATHSASTPPNPATRTAAAGGGAGQVWVNSETKVYHCQGDEWYGKTKKGEYMTEAAAAAAGDHPAHGKACTAK
jgi:hypothetical protein